MELRTGDAFNELVNELSVIQRRLLDHPQLDERSVLEGHKWIFSLLRTAMDMIVWADPHRPRFTDIVGPYNKWGADNADAFYCFAPLDASRTYRLRGRRADAVYLSITVYGATPAGRRTVAAANDRALDFAPDGAFELILGPAEDADLTLTPDARSVITRDYLPDPWKGRRTEWHIECLDAPPAQDREEDAMLAFRFQLALHWIRQYGKDIRPPDDANRISAPFLARDQPLVRESDDAAYATGTFSLAQGEALVVEGRSPECVFWNLCLWNPFQHTYNYDRERVSINGHQVTYEPDGSWRIIISAEDPGHPNWVSTAGHPRGWMWFRWFLPAHLPDHPRTRVMQTAELTR